MTRRLAIVGGLFLALVIVLVLAPPDAGKQPPLTVYSAQPEGGRALRLWLEALGRDVVTLEDERYTISRDVGTMLLLSPTEPLTGAAQRALEGWVREGGTLVIADGSFTTSALLRRFDLSLRPIADVIRAVPAGPGRLDPSIDTVAVSPRFAVRQSEGPDRLEPLLLGVRDGEPSNVGRPVLAARISVGRGEVTVLTVPELLSNHGLRMEANARLALSLIEQNSDARGRARIAVDEYHHGYGRVQGRSTFTLLFEYAWGRAALLAGVIALLFLMWRGRRLGRAVPVFIDRGRSLGELVTSQAALYRAGGKRQFVAEHLARQWRHDFALAVGLPPDAPDAEIGARASVLGRDASRALRVLAHVRQARTDRQLVALSREA
ncbi:MAG: DUF4350 domain-containing protein, partial [Chloroflexota bacterium]